MRIRLLGLGVLILSLAGCAAGRNGRSVPSAYEPGQVFENKAAALLGVGFLMSGPLLTPGLSAPEARLLQAGESLAATARDGYQFPGLQNLLWPPQAGGILRTAFSQVGLPYRYGGTSPKTGFDCSGFVGWVYGQHDIKLPRSSPEMMNLGRAVDRPRLMPGDLVFFGRKKRVTHVGIYTGDNKYIHSPSRGKSIQESSLDDRARGEYYVGARRLLTAALPAPAAGSPPPPAPARPVESAPAAAARKHKVKAGDTLYDLARQYGVSLEALTTANKLDSKRPSNLRLGQILLVPTKTKTNQKRL